MLSESTAQIDEEVSKLEVDFYRAGGTLLVANLTPMNTAGAGLRWQNR